MLLPGLGVFLCQEQKVYFICVEDLISLSPLSL